MLKKYEIIELLGMDGGHFEKRLEKVLSTSAIFRDFVFLRSVEKTGLEKSGLKTFAILSRLPPQIS